MTTHRFILTCVALMILFDYVHLALGQQTLTQKQQEEIEALNQVIQPNPEIQSRLRDLVPPLPEDTTEQEWRDRIRELGPLSGDAYDRLVPQLIYWIVYAEITGGDVAEAMLPAFIITELGIGDQHIANALEPYIDTGHSRVDHEIRQMIGDIDNYEVIFKGRIHRDKELPRALIQHLYKRDAGRAVLTIQKAYGMNDAGQWRPVFWAEHQVSDVLWKWGYRFLDRDTVEPEADKALRELASHKDWWARLYVAEVMKQYPPFRSTELIEILRNDDDETVRTAIQEVIEDEERRRKAKEARQKHR